MFSGLLTETRNHKNHDSVLMYKCIPLACFSSDKMGTIMCAGGSSIEDLSLEMRAGGSSIEDPSLEIGLTPDKAISKIVLLLTNSRLNAQYCCNELISTNAGKAGSSFTKRFRTEELTSIFLLAIVFRILFTVILEIRRLIPVLVTVGPVTVASSTTRRSTSESFP